MLRPFRFFVDRPFQSANDETMATHPELLRTQVDRLEQVCRYVHGVRHYEYIIELLDGGGHRVLAARHRVIGGLRHSIELVRGLFPSLSSRRRLAFSFKCQNIPISEIARRLNVAHVLEGSIKMTGSQVRITAQLIDARDDVMVWSETYDRNLEDIFELHSEIADRVIEQMGVYQAEDGGVSPF